MSADASTREPAAADLEAAFRDMAAAARARAAAAVPGLVAAAATAADLGRAAELAAAAALGAVPWALLPLPLRRRIHGHGDPRDRGVDAVGWTPAGLWLVQVKWLRAPRLVGHDPVARLTNIRGACERAGLAVARCSIAAPPGVAVAADVPGADVHKKHGGRRKEIVGRPSNACRTPVERLSNACRTPVERQTSSVPDSELIGARPSLPRYDST